MHVVRAIRYDDLESYVKFAFGSHLGMSNLPKNKELLSRNIESSLEAFAEKISPSKNLLYLFVIENLSDGQVGGVSGIYPQIGNSLPYYYYREEILHPEIYDDLPMKSSLKVLKAVKITNGPSEICSLYLSPPFRKGGLGRLLSLSRFLFIYSFLTRFQETLIAEMRGYINENNSTPFWEHLGRYFLDLEFAKVQQMRDVNKNFIPFILPEYPIYIDLLPKEAQMMIGKIHENTQGALKILTHEGFLPSKDYDVFDAGPVVKANIQEIRTIKKAVKGRLSKIVTTQLESTNYIVSNGLLNFRACYSSLHQLGDDILLPAKTADALHLQEGDLITFSPLG